MAPPQAIMAPAPHPSKNKQRERVLFGKTIGTYLFAEEAEPLPRPSQVLQRFPCESRQVIAGDEIRTDTKLTNQADNTSTSNLFLFLVEGTSIVA